MSEPVYVHCIREIPARVRLGFGLLTLWPAPAVQIARIMEEDPEGDLLEIYEGHADPSDPDFLRALATDEGLRSLFFKLVWSCARGWKSKTMATIAFARPAVFAKVAFAALAISAPKDLSSLIDKKAKAAKGSGEEIHIPSWILKTATRLRGRGFEDAMEMSFTRLTFTALVEGEDRRADMKMAAIAARVGQTDEKGWKKFESTI